MRKSERPSRPAPKSLQPPPEGTEVLYGLRSGLAIFERRRQDIRRIGFDPGLRPELAELSSWAQATGVTCREEDERVLAARADSNQHEGLVLDVLPRRWLPAKELAAQLTKEPGVIIALDRVRNPQNIGALLRSAAFFGVKAVVLGAPAPHPGLPAFAQRIAEGGAEHLSLCRTTDLADTLGRLKSQGVLVLGADAHATSALDAIEVPACCVLVLGHEREGLGPRVKAQCNSLVSIHGSGALDSLNVAVAGGVLLAELWRRRGSASSAVPGGLAQAVEHRR
jgi:RNA methyltransferase, TrmH family